MISVFIVGGFLFLRYAFYTPQAEKPSPADTIKRTAPAIVQNSTDSPSADKPVTAPDNQESIHKTPLPEPTSGKDLESTATREASSPIASNLNETKKAIDAPIEKVSFGYLKLVGIISSGDNRSKNKAIIQNLLTSRQKTYALGAVVPYGSKIIHIDEKGITLAKDGIEKRLSVSDTVGNLEDIRFVKAKGYKKIAEKEWLITPNSLIKDTENIYQLLSEVSIRPNFSSGKIEGFKLNKVKPGGVFNGLGLAEGDMISTINGKALDSVTGAYEIYQQIRREPTIRLGLSREQQGIDLTYHIISYGPPKYDLKDVIGSSSIAKLFKSKK